VTCVCLTCVSHACADISQVTYVSVRQLSHMRVTCVCRACLDKRDVADFADVADSAREGRQDVDRSRGEERAGGGNEDRGGVTVVSGALYA